MKNTKYGRGLEKKWIDLSSGMKTKFLDFDVALAWMVMIKDLTQVWDLIIPMVWMVMPFTENGKTVVKISYKRN